MTYEKAIEVIKKNKPTSDPRLCGQELCLACDIAMESIEKQIPTTVKKDEVDCRGYTDLFICGKCGTYIQTPLLTKNCEYNYCPWCGNRLE